jgi:hypothetical protein
MLLQRYSEGWAYDVLRQEEQNLKDALEHVEEAVDHGKQGHAEVL